MKSTILYPFHPNKNNHNSYVKTLELAKRRSAKVLCFSVVQQESELDAAYLHLLDLHGYYQTTTNAWQNQDTTILKHIAYGDLGPNLDQCLEAERISMLVLPPDDLQRTTRIMEARLKGANQALEVFSF